VIQVATGNAEGVERGLEDELLQARTVGALPADTVALILLTGGAPAGSRERAASEPVAAATPAVHPTLFKQGNWDLTVPGKATYIDTTFPLQAANRKLLARLVRGKGQPVHENRLKEACGNVEMEAATLTGYLTRLRKHLRKNLANLPA